jgi:DNA-binding XRE family transcriptional regulator
MFDIFSAIEKFVSIIAPIRVTARLGMVFGEPPKDPIRVPNALDLFGRQLRKLRESRDLSQERLAELCGYEHKHIGRVERGERSVSFEGIIRIAYGLAMPPAELFKLIPAPKRLPRKGEFRGKIDSR